MSKEGGNSKFEQIRSRRHMLNQIPTKQSSKKDSNLIGGGNPIKSKRIKQPQITQNKLHLNNTSSAFQNSAQSVMGSEVDSFKQCFGMNKGNSLEPYNPSQSQTSQAFAHKNSLSSGIAFNNDRTVMGKIKYSIPGITKKKDRDPLNVRDIDGATSKTKSYIMK